MVTKKEITTMRAAIKKQLGFIKQVKKKRDKKGLDTTDLKEQIAFIEMKMS